MYINVFKEGVIIMVTLLCFHFSSCENIISDLLQYIHKLCQFYSVTLNKIYFSQYNCLLFCLLPFTDSSFFFK